MKKFNKGFTLIELLVVIAIIGILSSVVLASLNTARSKGSDAAIKSQLSSIRAEASIFYDTNNTYVNLFAAGQQALKLLNASASSSNVNVTDYSASGSGAPAIGNAGYAASTTGYVIYVPLKAVPSVWCVDSNGFTGSTTPPANIRSSGCQ